MQEMEIISFAVKVRS